MLRLPVGIARPCGILLSLILLTVTLSFAQFETATVSGQVSDPSGLNVAGARVDLVDIDRGTSISAATNNSGLYRFASVHPGRYRMEVRAVGFRLINFTGLTVNVQDHLEQNFRLTVGSVSESVTVDGGTPQVDTESGAVNTVIDRQFAENLPMNGRSFQTLIQQTPGVVLTANNGVDTGQFSINGQRANANYWTVDGASANIGINAGATAGSGVAGTLGSTSVFGGTNSLVSVDALQEFRIQTSTYAPEFGRTPGGQISIVTRSGTNQFHGTLFDYFRNEVLDANDWFNGFTNNPPLPKAKERQNDFGGTFSGPILKNKTFFFFSYEGFRLRLPQTALTFVPDASFTPGTTNSRQNAAPALQPYLNAYPLPNPNSPEILCNPNTDPFCPSSGISGYAAFNASYSNPGTLDAYSLRVDHKLSDRLNLFGRYNYSPSELDQRGASVSLSTIVPTKITTQTVTVGATWAILPTVANDFRFNYSSTDAATSARLDNFGGAVPLETVPFPSPFTAQNANLSFQVLGLGSDHSNLLTGANAHNQQRQLNILDNVSLQKGSHSLKFGVDYRRLSPRVDTAAYSQANLFLDIPSAETGALYGSLIDSSLPATFLFRNLGFFSQDTWRIVRRLTLTYGLRWDVDFAPASISGPEFNAVTGFNFSNLSNLALLPAGTLPYKTKWSNLAPRIGLAYKVSESQNRQTVLRGGFGVFYDLASSEAGNGQFATITYPFGSTKAVLGTAIGGTATFPLTAGGATPGPIALPNVSNSQILYAFDPRLKSPYTLQWNVAVEQALGMQQTLSVSYIGATGRRLIQTASITNPNPNLSKAQLVTNSGTSNYNALQIQFQRRLSRRLQALASYSWSHSIDTASAGSIGSGSNAFVAGLNPNVNRGPSDFDVRNAFSLALTYDVPASIGNALAKAILRGWSTENIIQARSATPVDVSYGSSVFPQLSNGFTTNLRPDVVAGQPFYLYGSQFPGNKAFNSLAFTPPTNTVPAGCVLGVDFPCSPVGQGNLPRNALRGFGAAQWDFAVHRDFPIHESVRLQFRAEMFNILNHPNFGPPVGNLSSTNPPFGRSSALQGQSLNGNGLGSGSGGFDPLYQLGGPRSIQFALKLFF
jgi:hypothetical protein